MSPTCGPGDSEALVWMPAGSAEEALAEEEVWSALKEWGSGQGHVSDHSLNESARDSELCGLAPVAWRW